MELEEVCMSMEDKLFEKKLKIVTKSHHQFAHPSEKNLKALFKNAEHLDDEISQIVDTISAECETCKRYKKTPLTPVVSLPLATRLMRVNVNFQSNFMLKFVQQEHSHHGPTESVSVTTM